MHANYASNNRKRDNVKIIRIAVGFSLHSLKNGKRIMIFSAGHRHRHFAREIKINMEESPTR